MAVEGKSESPSSGVDSCGLYLILALYPLMLMSLGSLLDPAESQFPRVGSEAGSEGYLPQNAEADSDSFLCQLSSNSPQPNSEASPLQPGAWFLPHPGIFSLPGFIASKTWRLYVSLSPVAFFKRDVLNCVCAGGGESTCVYVHMSVSLPKPEGVGSP